MKIRIRAALANESGNFMIQTLVGSIVSLTLLGVMAASIIGMTQFQAKTNLRLDITNQAALTDSAFRNDLLWASSITAVDDHKLEMTVPGFDGQCKVSTWTIETTGGTTTVNNSVAIHPGFDTSTDPVACTGTPSIPSPLTLVTDAASDSGFTYANAGGRGLDVVAGSVSITGTATAPAGVSAADWASSKVAAVALETTIGASTDLAVDYRFAQTANNLDAASPAADADTHFVPEGNITAIP